MFLIAGAIAAVVSCIVNIWWKISAHLAAMGGFARSVIQDIIRRYLYI